jgi:hypothetical protein
MKHQNSQKENFNMKTFKEQFDKMTNEYIHGKVNPYQASFCFCGNLENHGVSWRAARNFDDSVFPALKYLHGMEDLEYMPSQYTQMEQAFMHPITNYLYEKRVYVMLGLAEWVDEYNAGNIVDEGYEDVLFEGFQNALAVLERIHRERGENVDAPVFVKRERNVPQLV